MADQAQLGLLLLGRQQWNEWREANPAIRPDLRKADLHETDLNGANLSDAVLIDANLQRADLRGANLVSANLRRADLRESNFQQANLHGAILARTDLRDANLRSADIREADLRDARLPGAILEGANLSGAVLNKEGYRYVAQHSGPVDTVRATERAVEAGLPAHKSRYLKTALAASGLMIGLALAGLLTSRQTARVDPRLEEAAAEAIGGNSGVDLVEMQDQALILRSGLASIDSGTYLNLLKTACQTVQDMDPPASGLREIRIINQDGQQGWIYGAPEKCGEIMSTPAILSGLSIAAHTKPIAGP